MGKWLKIFGKCKKKKKGKEFFLSRKVEKVVFYTQKISILCVKIHAKSAIFFTYPVFQGLLKIFDKKIF